MYPTHNEGKSVIADRFIEPERTKFTNAWIQYQKMRIFLNWMT